MMIRFSRSTACAALAAAFALSGCVGPGPSPRPFSQQSGVEGQWMDAQGVAISRFSGGRFESVATDTGNRLSEGSYTMHDRSNVEISMTSLIRQTTTRVNCTLVSPSQLNCTNAQGQNFVLTRRG